MQVNISIQNNIPKEFILQFFKSLTFVDDISFISEPEIKKKTNKKKVELMEFNKNLNIETVVNDLKKENYNNDFINDIVTGLKKSSVYANKD